MKVAGIITEYNPFHNGHKHHIDETRRITGADYVIAVMSGDFVQRGTPAVISKYDRVFMALKNGVDLVLELPACYATGSAQYFALGAVALLNSLGVVDSLCFGSECGDVDMLGNAASLLYNPSESYQKTLYSFIKEGYTYPAARAKAAAKFMKDYGNTESRDIYDIISEPNNILGIEYISALRQLNSSIKPYTIKRHYAHYHDRRIHTRDSAGDSASDAGRGNVISSATAIRGFLENAADLMELRLVSDSVPESVYEYLLANLNGTYPVTIEDFAAIIKYKLMYEDSMALAEYLDLSHDMAERIKNMDFHNLSITELAQMIKTKNITLTRVNRALIHVLLNIKKDPVHEYKENGIVYYARILGIKKEASPLVRKIKKLGSLPVITKVAGSEKHLDYPGWHMLSQDIFAAHLYNQALFSKFKTVVPNEYKHGIVIV